VTRKGDRLGDAVCAKVTKWGPRWLTQVAAQSPSRFWLLIPSRRRVTRALPGRLYQVKGGASGETRAENIQNILIFPGAVRTQNERTPCRGLQQMSKYTLKQIMALALCSAAVSSGMASAATCSPSDTKVAGHYYLHGIRDVGSELLLRPDGSFEYGLSYGTTDQAAVGCWSHSGDRIILTPDKPSSLPKISVAIAGLKADFDGSFGTYARD